MSFQRVDYLRSGPNSLAPPKWPPASAALDVGWCAARSRWARNRLYRVTLAACPVDHDPANPAPHLSTRQHLPL